MASNTMNIQMDGNTPWINTREIETEQVNNALVARVEMPGNPASLIALAADKLIVTGVAQIRAERTLLGSFLLDETVAINLVSGIIKSVGEDKVLEILGYAKK